MFDIQMAESILIILSSLIGFGAMILNLFTPVLLIDLIHRTIFLIEFVLSPTDLSRILSWLSFENFLSTKLETCGEIPQACEALCKYAVLYLAQN